MLRKYFWIFVKIEKVLEKILACNGVLKIQICSGKNFKSREKQIWRKIKYEISTDLPSVRARRFESDERDLSPAPTYHCSARPREIDEDELSTLRHTFFDCLLLEWVVVGTFLGEDSSASSCTFGPDLFLIIEHCSFLGQNGNLSSFPLMLKRISPAPTSI